jgi:hypothetical protein
LHVPHFWSAPDFVRARSFVWRGCNKILYAEACIVVRRRANCSILRPGICRRLLSLGCKPSSGPQNHWETRLEAALEQACSVDPPLGNVRRLKLIKQSMQGPQSSICGVFVLSLLHKTNFHPHDRFLAAPDGIFDKAYWLMPRLTSGSPSQYSSFIAPFLRSQLFFVQACSEYKPAMRRAC